MGTDGAAIPQQHAERRQRREERPEQLRWIAQARCLAAALDRLPQPLLLVLPGRPLRVWHANTAARCRFTAAGPLCLRDDLLLVTDPAAAARIHWLMRSACRAGPGQRFQMDLEAAGGGSAAIVRIEALAFGTNPDLPVSHVMLFEVHEREMPGLALQWLCRDYGLTRKEAETALRLYATGSVGAIARQACRSVHTVRTQLKAAMLKTNTHSQAGLVALVGSRRN